MLKYSCQVYKEKPETQCAWYIHIVCHLLGYRYGILCMENITSHCVGRCGRIYMSRAYSYVVRLFHTYIFKHEKLVNIPTKRKEMKKKRIGHIIYKLKQQPPEEMRKCHIWKVFVFCFICCMCFCVWLSGSTCAHMGVWVCVWVRLWWIIVFSVFYMPMPMHKRYIAIFGVRSHCLSTSSHPLHISYHYLCIHTHTHTPTKDPKWFLRSLGFSLSKASHSWHQNFQKSIFFMP